MISNIHIENFALIKNQTIGFWSGLNIVTGETGSGKSILAKAISGIFGEEIGNEQIMHGENTIRIQCELELSSKKCLAIKEMTDIDAEENTYIISRTVQNVGKNRARLNGSIISMSTLKQIGDMVFDFHILARP